MSFVFVNQMGMEPPILADASLSRILAIGERGTNRRARPISLQLTRNSDHWQALEHRFDCRVRVRVKRSALVIRNPRG